MFNRIISTLLLGLCANSVSAYEPNIPVHPLSVNANGSSWLCSDCGSPYTRQGLQKFAVRAHNLAWGASKQKIVLNPRAVNGRRFYVGSGSWHDLRITNGVDTVSVSFKASATDSFLMMIGGKVGAALTLQLEFGNGHVEFVNVIYRPGHDYIIVPVEKGEAAKDKEEVVDAGGGVSRGMEYYSDIGRRAYEKSRYPWGSDYQSWLNARFTSNVRMFNCYATNGGGGTICFPH